MSHDQNQNKVSTKKETQMWESGGSGVSGEPDAWLMGGRDGMVRDGPGEVGA